MLFDVFLGLVVRVCCFLPFGCCFDLLLGLVFSLS